MTEGLSRNGPRFLLIRFCLIWMACSGFDSRVWKDARATSICGMKTVARWKEEDKTASISYLGELLHPFFARRSVADGLISCSSNYRTAHAFQVDILLKPFVLARFDTLVNVESSLLLVFAKERSIEVEKRNSRYHAKLLELTSFFYEYFFTRPNRDTTTVKHGRIIIYACTYTHIIIYT